MKHKVALIGLGKQAHKYHLSGFDNSKNAELTAVCDIDISKVEEVCKTHNVKGYTSIDLLLQNEEIDYVIIATPHNTHLSIIKKVAEKGINILKEKPFAKNLDEALELIEIIKDTKVELMVTLQRRFSLTYTKFFEYINRVGNLSFIDMKYNIFADNPHPEWRGSKEESGGGCILDMGYHMIDLLLWYFGMPKSLYSNYSTITEEFKPAEVEDTASIIFNYEGGLSGNINLSRFSLPKTEFVKIIGSKGILEIKKDRINLFDSQGNLVECVIAKNLTDQEYANRQIEYFSEVLNKEKSNKSNVINNLGHMLFIEGCYQSKAENKSINPMNLLKNAIQKEELENVTRF